MANQVSGHAPMSTPDEITTDRLVLRRWREADLVAFAEINGDPVVMEFFPAPLDRRQSDAFVSWAEGSFADHGFGMWAVERRSVLIGSVGLATVSFPAAFAPAVEVGWRLGKDHWGHGYATEAARAALTFGFDQVGLDEIVSFTAACNQRSQSVMARIPMTRDPGCDFDHPRVAPDSPLRCHVLYRASRRNWSPTTGP